MQASCLCFEYETNYFDLFWGFCVYCDNSRHISRRVSSIWVFYVCLYVYEDSNFGSLRTPDVCAYAHKWLQHLASSTSGIRSELWPMPMERTCFFLNNNIYSYNGIKVF